MGSKETLRADFEVPDEVAYFNTANMSPLLRSVREAGEEALARRARPWTISPADWFTDVERLRALFASLIGADPDGVALIPATSYGLAIAARALHATSEDEVVVLAGEYPSNYYTWKRFCERTGARLAVVDRPDDQSWREATLRRIDERTRVVAVPNVHWTNGALLELDAVSSAARAVGAAFVIDASQSLGALPLDVQVLQPDFLVAVGYKWLLGPVSVGYLYVADRHRDGEPLEENWVNRAGSEDFSGLVDYSDAYRPGARRFDVGQRTNFGLVPMAIAALEQVHEWSVPSIARELGEITETIATRAAELGLPVPALDRRAPHMLGINLPGAVARRVGARLEERGVVASVRGNSVRISPHLHVRAADVDRLMDGLAAAL